MAPSYFVPVQEQAHKQFSFTYPAVADSPLILCVDDDPTILELLEDVLTACGLRALCTTDCTTALRWVASEPIDLIVLDYQMPQMDGLMLAQQMRRHKSQIPMIMFSGALLPCEAIDIVSRIIRKGEGALPLASAILETLDDENRAA